MRLSSLIATASLAASALAHYTLPTLIVNGQPSGEWVNIRRTNNYNTQAPVQDVTSPDFTCYTSETHATATTAEVAAGSSVSIKANGPMYHAGVVNVYMASANPDAASYDGSGQKWFKVYEIPPVTNGGSSISFPGSDIDTITFTIPKSLPSGDYLIRAEHIALHSASSFGGAQFYLSCAQVKVTGGGNGSPGPLVSIPGVYTGNEPGILINIYYPVPANYTMPGPAVWHG
ncbi:glycoside hydrolase family 61 protein [Schizophyllum commune H4-8]|uniref:lytic cellulose monooxygenase (C4-dehydrogenating) n=1 Tax=Schizophyllum commune (strain H4-8 / FGSC 9210) TaxID=578458 RepID=D8QHH2_SCHCM|nr:glycoside hydrolase family 61 protein [Schizophyllum commune H4-8]KAI5887184.1 glycoside hydrolase family 61 protein [Schizophyllum commune H4-8]